MHVYVRCKHCVSHLSTRRCCLCACKHIYPRHCLESSECDYCEAYGSILDHYRHLGTYCGARWVKGAVIMYLRSLSSWTLRTLRLGEWRKLQGSETSAGGRKSFLSVDSPMKFVRTRKKYCSQKSPTLFLDIWTSTTGCEIHISEINDDNFFNLFN